MRQLLQIFYVIYAFLLFLIGLLILFPGVILAVLIGQPAGGNLVIRMCRVWSDCWLFAVAIRNRTITAEPINPGRHYVFVANHISYLDIPVIFQSIRKNSFRVLGKYEMSKIPIFGILYRLAVVLVDRSSNANRAKSMQVLKKILDQNISILIFPEGTFNLTDKPLKHFYDGAFRIAIETGTAIKPLVYLDTVELMHYNSPLSLRPGISRVVILPEISVKGLTLADVPLLKKMVFDEMEKTIIAYRTPLTVATSS